MSVVTAVPQLMVMSVDVLIDFFFTVAMVADTPKREINANVWLLRDTPVLWSLCAWWYFSSNMLPLPKYSFCDCFLVCGCYIHIVVCPWCHITSRHLQMHV